MGHHTFYFKDAKDYSKMFNIREFFNTCQLKNIYVKPKESNKLNIVVIRSNIFDASINNEEKHGVAVPLHGQIHFVSTEKEFEHSESAFKSGYKFGFNFYTDSGSKIENPAEHFEFVCIDVEFMVMFDDYDDDTDSEEPIQMPAKKNKK